MVLQMRSIAEVRELQVYTDSGDLFGEVEDAIVKKNKVEGWKVRATRDSFLTKAMPNAKGVIIPHQLVKSIGHIMIISRAAAPSYSRED